MTVIAIPATPRRSAAENYPATRDMLQYNTAMIMKITVDFFVTFQLLTILVLHIAVKTKKQKFQDLARFMVSGTSVHLDQ